MYVRVKRSFPCVIIDNSYNCSKSDKNRWVSCCSMKQIKGQRIRNLVIFPFRISRVRRHAVFCLFHETMRSLYTVEPGALIHGNLLPGSRMSRRSYMVG